MKFKNVIGLGVAGNFAGHLEQAGEAADFASITTIEEIQPKAIFPFYVPAPQAGFLVQKKFCFQQKMLIIFRSSLKLR